MTQHGCAGMKAAFSLFVLLVTSVLGAQDRKVDPTWLHRYVPNLQQVKVGFSSDGCEYRAVFGEGDADSRILRSISRFGEVTLHDKARCVATSYEREEELYFVEKGTVTLHYGDRSYSMHANDFTYVPPRAQHELANDSNQVAQVVVMGFKIPARISISDPAAELKIVNMDSLKEETVDGHPNSVLYKLMAGPRTGKRDAIDQAYVVTSLFWMDFAPGGTNFPHHHETAEEIYLVVDGVGDMVAGGGVDGVEGRHAAKAGDAYYFRSNCTVGFYNQNKPGAKAHILAVRSKIPLPEEED
jgi:mannose-6-phosphate isomerase-like protein (cupin superfamily)